MIKKFTIGLYALFFIFTLIFSGCYYEAPTEEITTEEPIETDTPTPESILFMDNGSEKADFINAVSNFDFNYAINLISKYKDNNLEKEVINYLEIAQADEVECDVSYDEFTEKTTLYSKATSDDNLRASITSQGYLVLQFFTLRNDWIFWYTVNIKADGEYIKYSFNYFDMTQDVISNSKCYESNYRIYAYNINEFEKIVNAKDLMIRFSGDDYYYDAKIPAQTKTSIKHVLSIYKAINEIYNIIGN